MFKARVRVGPSTSETRLAALWRPQEFDDVAVAVERRDVADDILAYVERFLHLASIVARFNGLRLECEPLGEDVRRGLCCPTLSNAMTSSSCAISATSI